MNNEVGKTYSRPWGTYQTLDLGDGYQVKIISVNPKGKLSLQKHFKRSEHWVVITGQPLITIGCITKTYSAGEAVYIPQEEIHRIANNTDQTVKIVEVQIGTYLGEDDIVRLADVYGRA